jgi:hypothetical protein
MGNTFFENTSRKVVHKWSSFWELIFQKILKNHLWLQKFDHRDVRNPLNCGYFQNLGLCRDNRPFKTERNSGYECKFPRPYRRARDNSFSRTPLFVPRAPFLKKMSTWLISPKFSFYNFTSKSDRYSYDVQIQNIARDVIWSKSK